MEDDFINREREQERKIIARERARVYYQEHREEVKRRNLARYYQRMGREQTKNKKLSLDERLGEMYMLDEQRA